MKSIVSVGVIVLLVSVYIFRKKLINILEKNDENIDDNIVNSTSFKDGCMDELNKIGRDFEFLYEKTYSCITNNNVYADPQYIISEWERRLRTNSALYLIEAWKSIIKKYFDNEFYRESKNQDQGQIKKALEEWSLFLKELGITRDNRNELIIEDNSIHHIYFVNDVWKIKDVLTIIQPAWFYNKKFVEKGIAKVKNK